MNRIHLTKVLRESGKLHIVEMEGRPLYATDGFWMAPAKESVGELFAWWNVPMEPGHYQIGTYSRLELVGSNAPDIGSIMSRDYSAIKRSVMKVKGHPVQVAEVAKGGLLSVLDGTPADPVFVRTDYLKLAYGEGWADAIWYGTTTGPIAARLDGPMVLTMPFRVMGA